ncbi:MAG: hypothetical protein KF878_04320 [Planctomycetes bacterium]|nr:hypothetical protein [Planctomycetota bacterium]
MSSLEVADTAFRHLAGELLVMMDAAEPLHGPDAGPWCELLADLGSSERQEVVYTVAPLLSKLCALPQIEQADRERLNRASRSQLEFAWRATKRNSGLVIQGLENVCMTFAGEPGQSADLLRRSLEPAHLARFGYEELPRLCLRLEHILPIDPAFVVEVYSAAYGYTEKSTEEVQLGRSRILSMRSNKRQDYHHARWQLTKLFPEFLEKSPEHATRALARSIAAHRALKVDSEPYSNLEDAQAFEFSGGRGLLREDASSLWDRGKETSDDACQILHAFQVGLEKWPAEREAELDRVIAVVVQENHHAAVWRRLLGAAKTHPMLGWKLRSLASQPAFLTCRDTSLRVGALAASLVEKLDSTQRVAIEQAIAALPRAELPPGTSARRLQRMQGSLLELLAKHGFVTESAKTAWGELQATLPAGESFAGPDDDEPMRFGRLTPVDADDRWLEWEGIDVKASESRAILNRIRTVAERMKAPRPWSLELASTILADFEALSASSLVQALPEQLSKRIWDALAATAGGLLLKAGPHVEAKRAALIAALLEASRHSDPQFNAEAEESFEHSPMWGSCVRITTAEQIGTVVGAGVASEGPLLDALEALSRDPVVSVRYQIARRLEALAQAQPTVFQAVLTSRMREETSDPVLSQIIWGPLAAILEQPVGRELLTLARHRTNDGEDWKESREAIVTRYLELYIRTGDAEAKSFLQSLLGNPAKHSPESARIPALMRDCMRMGPVLPPDPAIDAQRGRVLGLMRGLTHDVVKLIGSLERTYSNVTSRDEIPADSLQEWEALVSVAHSLDMELYFGSGAHDVEDNKGGNETAESKGQRERFYTEARDILETLGSLGHPSTTHRLMEIYETLVSFDARGVFLAVHRMVVAGVGGGYQHESMGADQIVKFVGRYLADHRHIFRDDEKSRAALRELLDVFVKAGWPSARRLTHRLEEVFR